MEVGLGIVSIGTVVQRLPPHEYAPLAILYAELEELFHNHLPPERFQWQTNLSGGEN